MLKTLILTVMFIWLSINALAAVNLQECSDEIGMNLRLDAGATGDISAQLPFSVKGNKVVINSPKAIVSKEISDNKEVYKYKVALGGGIYEIRTLEIRKDQQGNITVIRLDDLKAQKKAFEGLYDKAYEDFPMRSGLEKTYSTKTGKCELVQLVVLKSMGDLKIPGEVYIDKKYCDAIKELTKGEGQEKTQQCVDILDKAQKLFNNRQIELAAESKAFSAFEPGMAGAAMKIAMCSPAEFKIREDALSGFGMMGIGSFNKSGAGMTGPNTDQSSKDVKKSNAK